MFYVIERRKDRGRMWGVAAMSFETRGCAEYIFYLYKDIGYLYIYDTSNLTRGNGR